MRRKRHDWTAKIEAWTDSGLTVSEYCRKHGLPVSGFYKAKNRIVTGRPGKNHRPKILDVTSVLTAPETSLNLMPMQKPTLRITSKDGHILEVYL